MKIKHLITTVAVLSIVGVGSAYAFPQNGGQGQNRQDLPKNHPPIQQQKKLSDEDMAAWEKLHDAHIAKVEPIRNILKARNMELKALANNTKVTPDYLRDLTEEIVNLQSRISKLNDAFYKESSEKFNIDLRGMKNKRSDRMDAQCTRSQGKYGKQDGNNRNRRDGKQNARQHMMQNSPCQTMHGMRGMHGIMAPQFMQRSNCPAMQGFMHAPHAMPQFMQQGNCPAIHGFMQAPQGMHGMMQGHRFNIPKQHANCIEQYKPNKEDRKEAREAREARKDTREMAREMAREMDRQMPPNHPEVSEAQAE